MAQSFNTLIHYKLMGYCDMCWAVGWEIKSIASNAFSMETIEVGDHERRKCSTDDAASTNTMFTTTSTTQTERDEVGSLC